MHLSALLATTLVFCWAAEKAKDPLQIKLEALIAAAGGNRTAASPGNARAREWLKKEASSLKGWVVEEQPFTPDIDYAIRSHKADLAAFERLPKDAPNRMRAEAMLAELTKQLEGLRGKKGVNLVLRKPGSDPRLAKEVIVVSAHYDTITGRLEPFELSNDGPAPGADDNGAAVVVLLALARDFETLKTRRTLELVFFDFEEEFFLGSYAYAGGLSQRGLQARDINLEMIGFDKRAENSVRVYQRSEGHPGWEGDSKLAGLLVGKLNAEKLKAVALKNNFGNSDNWSFWKQFQVAVTVSQDWENGFNIEHYHQYNDTPETLDWPYVQKIRRAVAKAVPILVK